MDKPKLVQINKCQYCCGNGYIIIPADRNITEYRALFDPKCKAVAHKEPCEKCNESTTISL